MSAQEADKGMPSPGGQEQTRQEKDRARFTGCLLGGAVGDALGAAVEFMSRREILHRFGPEGITRHAPVYGGLGTITDDTQMTLFTAEGLIRSHVRLCSKGITSTPGVVANAYLRWLATQDEGHRPPTSQASGWLFQQRELHHQRAPGATCLNSLREMANLGRPAKNDSKGCGGVMRMAPVGLFLWRLQGRHRPEEAFRLGAELAALTHGHPTGSLTAGVLAVLILLLTDGAPLTEALTTARMLLKSAPGHEETLQAMDLAEELARTDRLHEAAIAEIGEGWIAEEALAISIYCALVAESFEHGIILAVNHDGDSDSTGSMTGNLLGAMHGRSAIPPQWLEPLELREVITELAEDLYAFPTWSISGYGQDDPIDIFRKYPGC